MVYRPITDAPPSSVGLAWRQDNEHPSVEEFIGVVRGRTVNSSRTAAARSASPAPAKKDRPAPRSQARNAPAAKGRRRR
jgi:hypothetical protein